MSQQTLLALTLAIAGFAPTPSFAGLTLAVAHYDSPTFSNGSSFSEPGVSESISLTSGVAKDLNLDPAGPTIRISSNRELTAVRRPATSRSKGSRSRSLMTTHIALRCRDRGEVSLSRGRAGRPSTLISGMVWK